MALGQHWSCCQCCPELSACLPASNGQQALLKGNLQQASYLCMAVCNALVAVPRSDASLECAFGPYSDDVSLAFAVFPFSDASLACAVFPFQMFVVHVPVFIFRCFSCICLCSILRALLLHLYQQGCSQQPPLKLKCSFRKDSVLMLRLQIPCRCGKNIVDLINLPVLDLVLDLSTHTHSLHTNRLCRGAAQPWRVSHCGIHTGKQFSRLHRCLLPWYSIDSLRVLQASRRRC